MRLKRAPLQLHVDERSPIPIRRQLTEQLKHFIEGGGFSRDRALPSIRALAGFLGINPNTVARVFEDLRQSGYVESRRGKGVFVSLTAPARLAPALREAFLREMVIRGAALGMTADDLAVGVLSLAGVRSRTAQETARILLVECNQPELDFFSRELEAHLPVRVDRVLLGSLAARARRRKPADRWRVAVTSFFHLAEVERRLSGTQVPVMALLAEARLETLHRLAQLPAGTRVGVASDDLEIAHNLKHSIANAGLPNLTLVGACRTEKEALGRLVRRADVIVCSTPAAERVRLHAGPTLQLIIDDRTIDKQAIDMLATFLVRAKDQETHRLPAPSSRRHTRVPASGRRQRQKARPEGAALL